MKEIQFHLGKKEYDLALRLFTSIFSTTTTEVGFRTKHFFFLPILKCLVPVEDKR